MTLDATTAEQPDDEAIPSGFAQLLAADTIKPRALPHRKPVKLQVKAGVYVTVLDFDAADELSEHYVRTAVELLTAVDTRLQWRIVAPGRFSGELLLAYTAQDGWVAG